LTAKNFAGLTATILNSGPHTGRTRVHARIRLHRQPRDRVQTLTTWFLGRRSGRKKRNRAIRLFWWFVRPVRPCRWTFQSDDDSSNPFGGWTNRV